MSSKEDILNSIKRHTRAQYDMPDLDTLEGIQYPDKTQQFIEISKGVGGDALLLDGDINQLIRTLYPEAKTIASNLPEITIATTNPDNVDDPHSLNGTDLAIVEGEIGVAENGCVWIPQNVKQKVIYFIAEYLVIVLDRNKIVNNMHEAYAKLDLGDKRFGVFISGPSKTADIEQALVVGAHGARGVTVVLR
ncbi:L-lactate dehydrogenase complex protein LldG [Dysgonomonas sp. PH5-45]|uniref:LutC/YkgG family protein n=1 Tax=unclassified Dysgonomonas TaxID=2630389 RepID=UPI002475CE01|nr:MULTISPECIES: LUD domain-containing protein [unclassified Dysgonomonas]MDH6355210.1 L-lactate dehydrogenase complex protein LldG [Dysgonomonas sp. PH5-45]MDH6388064.1 L-lactate dehydrogenase complex protein LldG [Dysgonomonas sp. PH5-37]